MKSKKLTFAAAFFLTLVMMLVVFTFRWVSNSIIFSDQDYWLTVTFSISILFVINYIVLNFLLNYYGNKQINEISTILPFELYENDNETLTFKSFNEKVSELSEKRASEMDTMREMETYRKEYVGNVSHELKTPLFSIQGYVETLIEGGVEDLSIRDKYLDRIDKSVERLLNIVKDLDMINQYEAGEINLNISNFDINLLIKEIKEMLEFEAEQRNTIVKLQTTQTQTFVEADKQKIAQVLINLISNAIYYSNREKAQITITTSILRNKVFVEVKDNGMGIKQEILPRIFERFYRVESSRSRREGGSGLGLAIVKHILEAHNQNISVESVYLEGAKFSFMLDKSVNYS
ncbi:sensor histidine kinase [Frigoriflavimonas asaccharolytica]|uniref:histidine kinase n=1 Tax=Frigoriflavimonas asaccharolytica TaxID=2735899 RepID=A0A8J8K8M8_9FLAO|nr:ATP-binding protein [Frigoriflavimonas asaccharolytica]NRS93093.1 two-component system phosphate regulon sensor histidine kinase PhoR [Frigoriflavimonas asaccharolytica]